MYLFQMRAKLSDCSLKLYQAFSGLYVGQLHNFQMCSLGHHRIRWQRDDVVTHLRQSFTLKKRNHRWKGCSFSVSASWPYHICSSGTKLTTCRILFSVSYTEQSCRVTECVKLVIIGISAVGGYKLGTYNPQHSHTDMHDQMQTPNK